MEHKISADTNYLIQENNQVIGIIDAKSVDRFISLPDNVELKAMLGYAVGIKENLFTRWRALEQHHWNKFLKAGGIHHLMILG